MPCENTPKRQRVQDTLAYRMLNLTHKACLVISCLFPINSLACAPNLCLCSISPTPVPSSLPPPMLMSNRTENPRLLTLICSLFFLPLSLLWLELHMARILIGLHNSALDILSASGSPYENGSLPGNKLAPQKEFLCQV